ncbi:MAG: oligosaccharide flippase family protein, partial [Solirubrobacteraceae bacterium]
MTGTSPPAVAEASARADQDPLLVTAAPETLREATFTGVRWGVFSRLVIEVLSFASSVVLARLVSPVGFGHAAIAMGVVAVASALTIEGFGTPLVQRKDITRAHVESALLLSLAGGVGLTVLFYLGTPAFAGSLGSENVSLVQLASPTFIAVSVAAIPRALLQRRLAFRVLYQVQMAALAAGVVVSISLAALGFGAYALVGGQLANPVVAALLYVPAAPRVRPAWRRRAWSEIAGFGSQTALSSLLFSV